ncbi:MAG: dihydrofolate reductase [Lachnospiraceae bacterium]
MNIITAVDKNWAIGNKGQQLVSIPHDQKMFRDETLGKVIVMGRKTLESLPGSKPLYGRTNIVLTSDRSYKASGAVICHSMEEAMAALRPYRPESIYVIGGQRIYEQFLPYCHTAYVTYIDFLYSADTYFPDLDQKEGWKLIQVSEEQTYFDLCYEYRIYKK